jgi:hypothetical protein
VAENGALDPVLLALAMNLLTLLRDAIESVDLNHSDFDLRLRQQCLLYFAKKMYRATLAGVTLVRASQSSQAFTLKRDQHYAYVAFHYYLENPRQSILFAASGPLRQRDKAIEIMEFNPEEATDPERQKQLRELEATANALYKEYSDLKVPKGKSGTTKNPKLIDWKEPDEHAMMVSLVRKGAEEMAKTGNAIPPDQIDAWCNQQVRSTQFFHASFPSQEMHGTPMGLIGDLNSEDEESETLNVDPHEPNGLIYIYLWYPLGVAGKLVEFAHAAGFTDRLTKLRKALESYREVFAGG